MTGADHYKEAERLLKAVAELTPPIAEHDLRAIQERALVHATLALAAEKLGTLEEQRLAEMLDDKIHEWMQAHLENEPHIYRDGSTA